jgi:hypothetical protein
LQSVLHQEGFKKLVTDVFGKRGRAWLAGLELSAAGRMVVDAWLREVAHLDAELSAQTRELERMARADARARFLQMVPGIGTYAATKIRRLRRLQGEPGQLVHPMSTGDRCKTPAGPSQMERPGFESPLCASSTNRSLSATIRKFRWAGAPFS